MGVYAQDVAVCNDRDRQCLLDCLDRLPVGRACQLALLCYGSAMNRKHLQQASATITEPWLAIHADYARLQHTNYPLATVSAQLNNGYTIAMIVMESAMAHLSDNSNEGR